MVNAIIKTQPADFDTLVRSVMLALAPNSKPVYRGVYNDWLAWCADNRVHPLDLTQETVRDYLIAKPVTKDTRARYLHILRRLAKNLSRLVKEYEPFYQMLQDMRVPTENLGGQERNKRALTPEEVEHLLMAWDGWHYREIRNRAIIAVLFATGIRRSECAALRWDDIDFEAGVITIRAGKGDKRREAAIVGDYGVDALRTWLLTQQDAATGEREWVFCATPAGDNLGADSPITDKTIYRVVKQTATRANIELAPHDARRTLLTEILTNGALLADAQAQAGHADAGTTMIYAQPANAKDRRNRFTTRYGKDKEHGNN